MPWRKLHRLQPSSQRYTIFIGLAATTASALLTWTGAEAGFAGSKVVAEAAIAACLLWFYIEPPSTPSTSKLIAMLIFSGMALGAAWIIFFSPDKPENGFIDWKSHPFIFTAIGFVNAALTAPLFEEKVVRGLIFSGLAKKLNSIISSISVSMLFAAAHSGSMVWAFVVSLILCWMMVKHKLNIYHRAIVHGAANSTILSWYFLN